MNSLSPTLRNSVQFPSISSTKRTDKRFFDMTKPHASSSLSKSNSKASSIGKYANPNPEIKISTNSN